MLIPMNQTGRLHIIRAVTTATQLCQINWWSNTNLRWHESDKNEIGINRNPTIRNLQFDSTWIRSPAPVSKSHKLVDCSTYSNLWATKRRWLKECIYQCCIEQEKNPRRRRPFAYKNLVKGASPCEGRIAFSGAIPWYIHRRYPRLWCVSSSLRLQ